MANIPEFKYAPMFQLGKDETEYYLLLSSSISFYFITFFPPTI